MRPVIYLAALAILSIMTSGLSYGADAPLPPVTIYAKAEPVPEGIKYSYRVKNNSKGVIAGFSIGADYFRGFAELHGVPVGWWVNTGILPPTSSSSPEGWEVQVDLEEESPVHALSWQIIDHDADSANFSSAMQNIAIQPGQSLGGFSVILATPDDSYLTGHWALTPVKLTGMPMEIYSAELVPDSACPPPQIYVSLKPNVLWPPNQKLITIDANIKVQDDSDPKPVIKLVSITANEPINTTKDIFGASYGTDDRSFSLRSDRKGEQKGGRIYTVTYSATNSCGNTDTSQATVTVPHDKRKK